MSSLSAAIPASFSLNLGACVRAPGDPNCLLARVKALYCHPSLYMRAETCARLAAAKGVEEQSSSFDDEAYYSCAARSSHSPPPAASRA